MNHKKIRIGFPKAKIKSCRSNQSKAKSLRVKSFRMSNAFLKYLFYSNSIPLRPNLLLQKHKNHENFPTPCIFIDVAYTTFESTNLRVD